jgi:hypothetical protein
LSHKLIASDRKSNSIHQCVCMHVKKRPIQSVSVSDNVLNIARQITECLPLVNCLLWLPASIHRLFFLQLVKSAIHTITNQDQRTHLIWMKSKSSSQWICLIHQKEKNIVVDILSSPLNNYHVHLNINLVRLHLLSICAMLINIDSSYMYTLPISNQQRSKAFYFLLTQAHRSGKNEWDM